MRSTIALQACEPQDHWFGPPTRDLMGALVQTCQRCGETKRPVPPAQRRWGPWGPYDAVMRWAL